MQLPWKATLSTAGTGSQRWQVSGLAEWRASPRQTVYRKPRLAMPRRAAWSRVVLAVVGACLVLFVVGPLLRLLWESSPRGLLEALRDDELRASIGLTVFTATTATLVAAFFGIPLAYLLARRQFPGRRLVQGLIDLPVVVPHPVAGIAL